MRYPAKQGLAAEQLRRPSSKKPRLSSSRTQKPGPVNHFGTAALPLACAVAEARKHGDIRGTPARRCRDHQAPAGPAPASRTTPWRRAAPTTGAARATAALPACGRTAVGGLIHGLICIRCHNSPADTSARAARRSSHCSRYAGAASSAASSSTNTRRNGSTSVTSPVVWNDRGRRA